MGIPGARVGTDYSTAAPGEVVWGDVGVLPRRVELRIAPFGWADVGADLGWIDAGLDVRFGLPAAPERWLPSNLALGVRSGQFGIFKDTKPTRSYWGRIEAYPLLHTSLQPANAQGNGGGRTAGRAVAAVGLDLGDFYRDVSHKPAYDEPHEFGPFETPHIDHELRLEVAVGYHLMTRRNAWFQATVQPYAVLSSDTTRHTWGMLVALSGGLFLPFVTAEAR